MDKECRDTPYGALQFRSYLGFSTRRRLNGAVR